MAIIQIAIPMEPKINKGFLPQYCYYWHRGNYTYSYDSSFSFLKKTADIECRLYSFFYSN